MNDRFKFRAWDKSFCRMIYNIFFFWKENTITMYELHKDASKSYIPNSHIVLEQCTGLKDKNGQLIYEGDIIIVDSSTINITDTQAIVFWDEYEASFNLQWLPQGSGANALKRIKKLSKHGVGDTRWWEIEVLGNIHENPELLENK